MMGRHTLLDLIAPHCHKIPGEIQASTPVAIITEDTVYAEVGILYQNQLPN